jgi:1-phosphofructokinase
VAGGTIAVLAPSVSVSITIETGSDEADDIHIHAGGQGIWVARMLRHLGYGPLVCAPVGGESGRTLLGLTGEWGIEVQPVETVAQTPSYVHDRRGGEREELARSRSSSLYRHEADELYQRFLEAALSSQACVVTGPESEDLLADDFYRRLGNDLAAAEVQVVADLHGQHLDRFLEGGPIDVLKVSAGDLVEDGRIDRTGDDDTDLEPIAVTVGTLVDRGVRGAVVSRGDRAALAWLDDRFWLVSGPELAVVDPAGSGDSMTAALATACVEDLRPDASLRRSWAAGAANVTRHGLGSGVPGLIEELSERVDLDTWTPSGTTTDSDEGADEEEDAPEAEEAS